MSHVLARMEGGLPKVRDGGVQGRGVPYCPLLRHVLSADWRCRSNVGVVEARVVKNAKPLHPFIAISSPINIRPPSFPHQEFSKRWWGGKEDNEARMVMADTENIAMALATTRVKVSLLLTAVNKGTNKDETIFICDVAFQHNVVTQTQLLLKADEEELAKKIGKYLQRSRALGKSNGRALGDQEGSGFVEERTEKTKKDLVQVKAQLQASDEEMKNLVGKLNDMKLEVTIKYMDEFDVVER
ncbi:hypothetical protein VNO78_28698 [Psophocarpus tetragonolobus]|uniref:Uncharacterized protein n=1 Tax=Psophocarpus tetragonolobus TaxID=3891 RepID=A0AAN9RTM9_PSOTE